MYDETLIAAGYTKHGKPHNNVQCWIKPGYEDINVDSGSGLWASEHATDEIGFGTDRHSLLCFLTVF